MTPTTEAFICFFCGEKLIPVPSNTWKGEVLRCHRCVRTLEINPSKYHEAYCWKRIKELEAKLDAAEKVIKEFRIKLNDPPMTECPKCKKKLEGWGPFDLRCAKCKVIFGSARPVRVEI